MSCPDTGPFDGGTYNDPAINNPTVSGGTFTNATLDGDVKLTNVSADALFKALQEQNPVPVSNDPKQSSADDLPAIIVGEDRTIILGRPYKWIKCGDGMIPVFRAG